MTEWQDLSEEDKIKVIVGMAGAATMLPLSFVFIEMFPRDYFPADASPFSGIRMAWLLMYIVVVIPTLLVAAGTIAVLKKRLSEMLNVFILLLMTGGYFLSVGLILTLFNVFLSGLPFEASIILIALALFLPAITIVKIMIAKKNSKYLKWAFNSSFKAD